MRQALAGSLLRRTSGHGPLVLMYHSVERTRGTPRWPWAVSLQRFADHLALLEDAGYRTCRVRELQDVIDAGERAVAITFDDGYADNFDAFEELSRRGMVATWFLVSRRLGSRADWLEGAEARRTLMGPQEARELAAAGMEVGGHSRTHVALRGVPPGQLQDEVAGSRQDLEDLLGQVVTSFAYPYGIFDDATVEAAQHAGYQRACTVRSGWVRSAEGPDALRLPRLEVGPRVRSDALARMLALGTSDGSWRMISRYLGSRVARRLRFRPTVRTAGHG